MFNEKVLRDTIELIAPQKITVLVPWQKRMVLLQRGSNHNSGFPTI